MTSVNPMFEYVDDAYLLTQPEDRRAGIVARMEATEAAFVELNTMTGWPTDEIAAAARRLIPGADGRTSNNIAAKVHHGVEVSGRLTYRKKDDAIFCFLATGRAPKAA